VAVKAKLESLRETKGVSVVEVNPAYTSQACFGCGYVAKSNRKNHKFTCHFCGNHSNADYNGAKNILRRSQDETSWLFVSHKEILRRLEEEFKSRWQLDFATVQTAGSRSDDKPKCRRATRGVVISYSLL
jgi:putative transposase